MGIVAETCDDIAVMYMGYIVEYGTADQVFETPMHPYTRGLMKAVPVLGLGRTMSLVRSGLDSRRFGNSCRLRIRTAL